MSDPHKKDSEKSVYLDREEHFHRGSVGAKIVVPYSYDSATDTLNPIVPSLVPKQDFDYIDFQQTNSTTETYVFKTGGSGGTTVQTIVVVYTSSAKSDIDTVTYS